MSQYEHLKDHQLLQGLNEKQAEAVMAPDESTIILAGAGSGKTKVLTTRIAWLLEHHRTTSDEVMAVTFTNKSAKEMKDRLAKMVETPLRNMWIGTFHGLCNRMLRENAKLAGLPGSFTIMDEDDQMAMIKRIIREENVQLPEDIKPKALQQYINKKKDQGERPGMPTSDSEIENIGAPFYARYEAKCHEQGTIDFAELMLRVNELFRNNSDFRDCYQNRFSHIHVDEFQDTNQMQYEWLNVIKGTRGVIFAVGDDDQSIYSFRGSRPENMNDFVRDEAEGRIIRLEQNYRSTSAILSAANSLIEKNTGRMGKNLWTDSSQGTPLRAIMYTNDRDEADHVATVLKAKIKAGENPSEMAILYRSNWQSRSFESALMAHGVPHVIYGGTKFFERQEVKDALAYVKLSVDLNDDTAFCRAINMPPRGLGNAAIEHISTISKENNIPMMESSSMAEDKTKKKVEPFIEIILDCFNKANELPLPAWTDYVLKKSGLIDHYSKKEDDVDRLNNLLEMVTAATRFCEESDTPDALNVPAIAIIDEFMSGAALEASTDNGKENIDPSMKANGQVTLMTVHASKGLEFDTVAVVGAEETIFPVTRALDEGNEEEERRLMYVAITRAKKDIIVTHTQTRMVHGEVKEMAESRFLTDIPMELKHVENRVKKRPAFNAQSEPKTWNQKSNFKFGPKR